MDGTDTSKAKQSNYNSEMEQRSRLSTLSPKRMYDPERRLLAHDPLRRVPSRDGRPRLGRYPCVAQGGLAGRVIAVS
jgi:hypothetical protein